MQTHPRTQTQARMGHGVSGGLAEHSWRISVLTVIELYEGPLIQTKTGTMIWPRFSCFYLFFSHSLREMIISTVSFIEIRVFLSCCVWICVAVAWKTQRERWAQIYLRHSSLCSAQFAAEKRRRKRRRRNALPNFTPSDAGSSPFKPLATSAITQVLEDMSRWLKCRAQWELHSADGTPASLYLPSRSFWSYSSHTHSYRLSHMRFLVMILSDVKAPIKSKSMFKVLPHIFCSKSPLWRSGSRPDNGKKRK